MKRTFSQVGHPVVRQDGLEKVTGQAKYGDDLHIPHLLVGVMVRIPESHATITGIDYSAIAGDPALIAICDNNDVPAAHKVGAIHKDQPIFSFEKVVTTGDVIAMLVGESEAALLLLRDQVKVHYTPLPVLSNPLDALKPDAPLIHAQYDSNLIVSYPLRKGDIDKGFAESDFTLEQTYTTPFIEHAYIEPEVVIAIPREGNKGIHIIGSIQNPYSTRRTVAAVLGWPLAKIRIEQAELGGSFGGKDDSMSILAARAAIAALKTGRPVKIRYHREDSIRESYKRHPYIMHYKVGFSKTGKLQAMKIDITADGGAYASMSPFVTWRTVVQAVGPYEIENVWTDVRAVYTNNPYTGAMRGFGSPQPIFAQESIMDEIARQVGLSPYEIRKRNGLKSGSITATGQKLENHDVNLLAVLEKAVETTDFKTQWEKNETQNKEVPAFLLKKTSKGSPAFSPLLADSDFIPPQHVLHKGIGLAVSFRGCSLGAEGIDAVAAYLAVQADGSVYLLCGLAENGQGLRTTFAIIAAEILGISIDHIYYLEQDTGLIPDSGPTVASRSTLMGGAAVKMAAEMVRERFEALLRQHWNVTAGAFAFKEQQVTLIEDPSKQITFAQLCALAYNHGINLAAMGWYKGPHVHWDEEKGQGDAYFTYVYGCQVAEVTVNIVTGEVYVDRVIAVHDIGTVINLLGAQGQIYGGVTQGAGYGLWEEISTHNGAVREMNFDQYLVPTSKDVGDITPIFIEGEDKYGPWGAKSLGEPALELAAAAIANGIRNAIGVRYFNLPLNLEEILLKEKLRPQDLKRGSA